MQEIQTVFGGLKLTETLSEELEKIKAMFDNKAEILDRS